MSPNQTFNPEVVFALMTGHEHPEQVTAQDLTNDAIRKGFIHAQWHFAVLRDGARLYGLRLDQRGYYYRGHDHGGWGIYVVGTEATDAQKATVARIAATEFPHTPLVWVPPPKPREKP